MANQNVLHEKIQLACTITAALVSLFSLAFAWNANHLSRLSLAKQFETSYSVECEVKDYKNEFMLYLDLYIMVPMSCSIANLGNRTITIDDIVGEYRQQTEKDPIFITSVYVDNVKDKDSKVISAEGFGDVNLPIAQGQKVEVSFDAQYSVTKNFRDYITCDSTDPHHIALRVKCKLRTDADANAQAEAWENVINTYRSNTINGKSDTRTIFKFTTTDDVVKESREICLYLQSCGFGF